MTDKAPLSVGSDAEAALRDTERRYNLFGAQPVTAASSEHREALILELAGDLLALRIADAEWVRREFGRRFGQGELDAPSAEDLDLSRAADGVVRVTFTLTSVRDWDRLRRAGYLASWQGIRGVFRDHATKRERWREPATIVRAVAVHYLSTAGGGPRTAQDAAELYAAHLEADADKWDASIHARIIRQVAAEYGPLP